MKSGRTCSISIGSGSERAASGCFGTRFGDGLPEPQTKQRWLRLEDIDVASSGRSHAWMLARGEPFRFSTQFPSKRALVERSLLRPRCRHAESALFLATFPSSPLRRLRRCHLADWIWLCHGTGSCAGRLANDILIGMLLLIDRKSVV